LKPVQANSSRDPILKITGAKWTEGVSQAIEHLLCKCEVLSSNPSPTINTYIHTYIHTHTYTHHPKTDWLKYYKDIKMLHDECCKCVQNSKGAVICDNIELKIIMLSEITQTQKEKCYMTSCMCGIQRC
jgi:hypothetical protein